jgi:hypothetical protein
MSRLADPGKGAASAEQAKQLRQQAWVRPADQRARDRLRSERVTDARGTMVTEAERRKRQLAAGAGGRIP